jgi:hypothetical protein
MDDFYLMYQNHTNALNNEERVMFVMKTFSTDYAETFYQCFILLKQIQNEAVIRDS